MYKGNSSYKLQLTLYHISDEEEENTSHFAVITRINAFISRAYYCSDCDKGFNNRNHHRCPVWCNICGRNGCIHNENIMVKCPDCNAPCRSIFCLNEHHSQKNGNKSLCEKMLFVPYCKVKLHNYKINGIDLDKHTCRESFCKNCQVMYNNDEEGDFHKCFMRSIPASNSNASIRRFIFYDFENMVNISGNHIPNLVIVQSICKNCSNVTRVKPNSKCNVCGSRCNKCDKWNKERTAFKYDPCMGCASREVIFHGPNTVNKFCMWLFSEQHVNVIVIAYNARAYDAYFIYNYLLTQSITPEIIFRGSKIMYCRVGRCLNIKILDSLNSLNMPLDKLPKSFGLKEMKKGYFPHLYNTQEMNNLEGSKFLPHLPPIKFYDVDNMNMEKREQFLIWYENNKHKCFDFYQELLEYCRSNVDILLNTCWKFRQLYMESTGPNNPIDLFDYITIA